MLDDCKCRGEVKQSNRVEWIFFVKAGTSLVFITCASLFMAFIFSQVQSEPYMDEIFHVRQTKSYLSGNWTEWDNKITTPPGTYFLFLSLYRLLGKFFSLSEVSLVFHLRCFNVFVSSLNYLLLLGIIRRLHGTRHAICTSLSIITNPVLFFFSALYYTDQCSLMFILLMLYSSLCGYGILSALFGSYGIFVRQTNVVWLFTSLCILVGRHITPLFSTTQDSSMLPARSWFSHLMGKTFRQPFVICLAVCRAVYKAPFHFTVVLGFMVFVQQNKGIVLGDKTAHLVVIHVCQLWYFVVFCTIHTPYEALQFLRRCFQRLCRCSITQLAYICFLISLALVFILFSLRYSSFVHPYLLADNRHYTFYIWRKVISRTPSTFYLLSLGYLFCSAFWVDCLFGSGLTFTHWLVNMSLVIGSVVCLVPAGLLEPRYFLPPYVLWRLFAMRLQSGSSKGWLFELSLNVLVIGITGYLFHSKPFFWTHEPGVQRFIW